ncbi:hypothetical protein Avbf_12924, partial [Armadillidium vulgare]
IIEYKESDADISNAAANHLWHLAPETAAFAIFDDDVPLDIKQKITAKMKTIDDNDNDNRIKRCTVKIEDFHGLKIYFAFIGSCKYVPTIYFETSKTINIKNSKCEFNVHSDKPNVSFHFITIESFSLDGVPIMLPCSPGGYVVDSSTGRFFHGNKCVENLNDPDYNVRYGGIDLVMELVYKSNENLLFPKKSFEKHGISPFP